MHVLFQAARAELCWRKEKVGGGFWWAAALVGAKPARPLAASHFKNGVALGYEIVGEKGRHLVYPAGQIVR